MGFQKQSILLTVFIEFVFLIQNHKIMSSTLKLTPLHDRVIVRPAPAEEKTAGGIITPDTAKEKPQRGTVVAAGPGKKDEPMTVRSSDKKRTPLHRQRRG